MYEIIMPRLGANDNYVTLVDWYKKDGEYCVPGDELCMLETTKYTEILEAQAAGYLKIACVQEEDICPGSIIGYLYPESLEEIKNEEKDTGSISYKVTNKAKQLAEMYHIDLCVFGNRALIREKDILTYIKEHADIKESGQDSFDLEKLKEEYLIFGSGGFCKTAIDILRRQKVGIRGIIDVNYPEIQEVNGVPVIGSLDSLEKLYLQGYRNIINTVSLNKRQRARRYNMLKNMGFQFPNIIHERAFVEDSAVLGEGNILMAGAYVGANTVIGNNCILNVNAVVSHDCKVGDSVNISSGAVVGGIVTIGNRVLIGQCTSIYWGLAIGDDAVIENGCHVFENIENQGHIRYQKNGN